MHVIEPIIGRWYHNLTDQQEFEVIVFEPDNDIIEIQNDDGDIEALDLDTWYELELEEIEEPQDWSGLSGMMRKSYIDESDSPYGEKWSSPHDLGDED